MSDETLASAEAPAEVEKTEAPPIEEAKAEAAVEPAEEPAEEAETTGDDKPKKRSWADRQRRKISYMAGALETKDGRIAELERELAQHRTPKLERPDPSKFPNGEFDPGFNEAIAEWKYKQLDAEKAASQRPNPLADHDLQSFQRKVQEKIPDLDAKIREFNEEGGALPLHVIKGLAKAPHGDAILNHILSNTDTAFELAEMTAEEALLKIGELNAAFKSAPKKAVTKAPPPAQPLKGGAGPAFDPRTGPDDMSAFASWLLKDLEGRSGR